jgi:hypothetical protein
MKRIVKLAQLSIAAAMLLAVSGCSRQREGFQGYVEADFMDFAGHFAALRNWNKINY